MFAFPHQNTVSLTYKSNSHVCIVQTFFAILQSVFRFVLILHIIELSNEIKSQLFDGFQSSLQLRRHEDSTCAFKIFGSPAGTPYFPFIAWCQT